MDAVWYCAMRTQAVCLVLLLTLASLVHSTSAEGDDETLERVMLGQSSFQILKQPFCSGGTLRQPMVCFLTN